MLQKEYFDHYTLFVKALWLLLQSSITSEEVDLQLADELLHEFCSRFTDYYGRYKIGMI